MYNSNYFSLNKKEDFLKCKLVNVSIADNEELSLSWNYNINLIKEINLYLPNEIKYVKVDFSGLIYILDSINNLYLYDDSFKRYELLISSNHIDKYELIKIISLKNRLYIASSDQNKIENIIEYSLSSRRIVSIKKSNKKDIINLELKESELCDFILETAKTENNDSIKIKIINLSDVKTIITNESYSYIDVDNLGNIYTFNTHNSVFKVFNICKFYTGVSEIVNGNCYLPILDSKVENNLWHRIRLYADITENTQMTIEYKSFDTLKLKDVNVENLKFCELSNFKIKEIENQIELTKFNSGDDFLFDKAYGRYLLVKINFNGNKSQSPKLSKIRVYMKRDTYIKYLPEIYQSNEQRDFLERFLSIFESINLEIEEKIDLISRNFDYKYNSDEMLKWISSWIGIEIDNSWNGDSIRDLFKMLPSLYKKRGTKFYIETILKIFLNCKIIIVENARLYSNLSNLRSTETKYERPFGLNRYSFTILCYRPTKLTKIEKNYIKKFLDGITPPYMEYNFIELKNTLFLDKHSYLGINTMIVDTLDSRLNNQRILSFTTIDKD
ncbi:hypothetical protein [Helicovermis profundi]|uniref:Phage tail protein n=1 Tax=Helicovermis profundi TaxID=3065157 RepID=A0AAU9E3D7_9FIRM|nr:hypothetical protein HLPR_13670 [Clostridia bacterium S502]